MNKETVACPEGIKICNLVAKVGLHQHVLNKLLFPRACHLKFPFLSWLGENRIFRLKEGTKKNNAFFWGKFSQMCEHTHSPQGFCEIWIKKGNFRGDLFFRGQELVWESATLPTHIIGKTFPQKRFFYPLSYLNISYYETVDTEGDRATVTKISRLPMCVRSPH